MKTKSNYFEKWIPTEKITNHDGTPIESKYLFILPPPDEIGEILSASSTFSKYHPISLFKLFVSYFAKLGSFVVISFIVSGISIISIWILSIWDSNKTVELIMTIVLCIAIPGLFNGLLYFIYVKLLLRKIYYIGNKGIAIFSFTFPFNKDNLKCQSFLYEHISSIKIQTIHHYDKQLSTRYKYTRCDATIDGYFQDTLKKHYNQDGKVFSNHPINFYLKANEMLLMFKAKRE